MQDEVADRLAERRAAGLARREHLVPPPRSHSASSAAWVVLPEPSCPSKVMNIGGPTIRRVRGGRTGGAGFIGSHLVDALVERGDDVLVLDDLSSGKRENVNPEATLVERDIRDAASTSTGCEVVFHLAAQADVQTSVARPDFDAEVNVVGTVQVLEAARRAGAQVVFSSTGGAIYGECARAGGRGRAAASRCSPYGIAKLCAEEYLFGWNRLHGARHVVARFANVYGPRQDAGLEGGVVAIFLERLAARRADDDLRRRAADARLRLRRRRGCRAARGRRATTAASSTSAAASGRRCSSCTGAAPQVAGSGAEPAFEDARLGDVRRSILDVSHAERELGWRPPTRSPTASGRPGPGRRRRSPADGRRRTRGRVAEPSGAPWRPRSTPRTSSFAPGGGQP